jgi:small subunit ribosomal protein S6e
VSYPVQGTTKSFDIDDDNKCRVFFEKRMGQEVEADTLGDEFKGYVFKINGGFDLDGFAMKQGVFSNGRVRLLLSPGSSGYRAKRTGERKRRSVRGCIVGPDIKMLSCTMVKKGEQEIPGLTDTIKPRRLGPKRASKIRKLYEIEKAEGGKTSNTTALLKKHVIRRTFKSAKNPDAHERQKAPKIQRLITDVRLRRKRIVKDRKVKRWRKTLAAT